MNIKIITDSACSISREKMDSMGVDMLPILITDGVNTYKDTVDITADEIYFHMKEGKVYKTSQIPLADYIIHFTKYASQNIPCLYVSIPLGLSSSYNTSLKALEFVKEEYPSANIRVLDSKLCATAHGIAVEAIAKLASEGESFERLEKELIYYQKKLFSFGYVDDLEYLYRGGRISRIASTLGGKLKIRPFIKANDRGALVTFGKARGNKGLYNKIVDTLVDEGDILQGKICISYTDNMKEAVDLAKNIAQRLDIDENRFVINQISATIGAHTGPGSAFIFFIKK